MKDILREDIGYVVHCEKEDCWASLGEAFELAEQFQLRYLR